MLAGIALVGLWLLVLVLAMGESATTFASRAKLEEALDQPARRDRYFRYLDASAAVTSVCILGRVAALGALIAIVAARVHPGNGVALASAAAVGIAFAALAELVGRLMGRKWSTGALVVLLPPLRAASLLFAPLSWLRRRLIPENSSGPAEDVVDAAKEEIRVAIEDAATEGAIEIDEKEMIEGVLEFMDVEVHEIMTPRTDIECIELATPWDEIIQAVQNFNHSRIPVYERVRDKVVGIVHVRDLLPLATSSEPGRKTLGEVMREPLFVPETKRIGSMLHDFRQHHGHMAIIMDEYGGVTGLVTLEDVVEEITGEIEDEFDQEDLESRLRKVGPGAIDVDARMHVDEVNEALGVDLPEDDDYDTVGGFMMARFARVPLKGQELRHNGVLVRVLESDKRRVHRVLVQRLDGEGPDEGT